MQSMEPILVLLFSDNSTHRQLSNFSRHPHRCSSKPETIKPDKGTSSSSNHQASIEHPLRGNVLGTTEEAGTVRKAGYVHLPDSSADKNIPRVHEITTSAYTESYKRSGILVLPFC